MSWGFTIEQVAAFFAIIATVCAGGYFIFKALRTQLERRALPEGFCKLEERKASDFRRFQNSEHLPYFGWRDYQASLGEKAYQPESPIECVDEIQLFERILKEEKSSILSGAGGVGKTRMALECCRYAIGAKEKWHVAIMENGADLEGVKALVERRRSLKMRTLIFLDYIEDLPRDFEVAELIDEVRRSNGYVKLVASCRTSFLFDERGQQKSWMQKIQLVDLSPASGSGYAAFLNSWKKAVADKICEDADTDNPAVAVIYRYANLLGHSPSSLGDLSVEQMVAEVLMKSVRNKSTASEISTREIAAYTQCFPISTDNIETLNLQAKNKSIYEALYADGWILRVNDRYEVGHDLLAEYPFIAALRAGFINGQNELGFLLESAERGKGIYGFFRTLALARPRIDETFSDEYLRQLTTVAVSTFYKYKEDQVLAETVLFLTDKSFSMSFKNDKFNVCSSLFALSDYALRMLEVIFAAERIAMPLFLWCDGIRPVSRAKTLIGLYYFQSLDPPENEVVDLITALRRVSMSFLQKDIGTMIQFLEGHLTFAEVSDMLVFNEKPLDGYSPLSFAADGVFKQQYLKAHPNTPHWLGLDNENYRIVNKPRQPNFSSALADAW